MRNRLSQTRLRKRAPLLGIEGLEDRVVPAAILNIQNAPTGIFPQFDLVDPNPNVGGAFGASTAYASAVYLPSGNIVVTDPSDDAGGVNAGAVYLFNGTTGALISTLTGSHANDFVGFNGVKALTNGNYVIGSPYWDNGAASNAGAVTWGNGTTGISGAVSATNSLVGSKANDEVGNSGVTVTALTNGNYVVGSPYWDNGAVVDAGAATWGDGTKGISGAVTVTNSLVGSKVNDIVGKSGVTALTNGNYIVNSQIWDNGVVVDAGAVTWGDGTKGISGAVAITNSLVGLKVFDVVGSGGVRALTNGNYVVSSSEWGNGVAFSAGAVTWGDGTKGISGAVTNTNSLVGSQAFDKVGRGGVTALTNGNYVVRSPEWGNTAVVDAGAVTWGDGTKGISGAVTAINSLVGSQTNDFVGLFGVTALTNGNYVVRSPNWDNSVVGNAGAATWGDGTKGIVGPVTAINSLVGSQTDDNVGRNGVTALTNGNYVVSSPDWDNGAVVDAGAATWGDGTKGVSGAITSTSSLVGSQASDFVGRDVTALTNGHYVVRSANWDNGAVVDAGAATWGDGTKGASGAVTVTNSLVGSQTNDAVGSDGVTALTNGNYVVRSARWDNGGVNRAGAATWGDGTKGISGTVTVTNSLVGLNTIDLVGSGGVTALTNGNYVVSSASWDNGAIVDAGAATWGNGTTGRTLDGLNTITPQNSLIGIATNAFLKSVTVSTDGKVFAAANTGRVVLGFPDANLLSFNRGGSRTLNVTPDLFTLSLNAGQAVVSQATAAIAVTSPIVVNNPTGNGGALTLESQGALLLNASITTDNGNLTLIGAITPAVGATVTTGTGTLTLPSGNLILNQTFDVSGGVDLAGAALLPGASLPLPTTPGQSYTLIDKPIAGAVIGTFAGLPEGAALTFNGLQYAISYTGGDGNDVVLIRTTPPTISDVGNQSGLTNATVGPVAFTVNDAETPLANLVVSATSSNLALIASDSIVIGGSAGSRTVTITPINGQSGVSTITLTVTDASGLTATDTFTVTITAQPVVLVGFPQFGVGADVGGGTATLFNPDKSVRFTVTPFTGFTGGVRTATADFNNDGVADLIVGTGPGIATRVVVLDGKTQAMLFDVAPFEASFQGGVYVSAGDVTGDGIPDLAITPDEGGGPRADVYSGALGFPKIASFFGIDDVNFRGGARSAIADMTGDGVADLIVVAGFGGGPRVAAFDGKSLSTGTPVKIFGDFFAFEQALRNGIFVTAGDINGDGFADLIAGGGPGGGPRVLALDGKSLLTNQYVNLANFFGGDVNSRGGIRVAVKNLDGDTKADLVVGSGSGAGSRVTGYLGKNIAADGTPTTQFDFDSIGGFTGGVFVG